MCLIELLSNEHQLFEEHLIPKYYGKKTVEAKPFPDLQKLSKSYSCSQVFI
jgi:hypothetical protein